MNIKLLLWMCWAFLCGFTSTAAEQKSYEGYQVLKLDAKNEQQHQKLRRIGESASDNEIEYWTPPRHTDAPIIVSASPDIVSRIHEVAKQENIKVTVITDNLQKDIQKEQASMRRQKRSTASRMGFNLRNFNSLSDINNRLSDIGELCSICETVSLGHSYEGRDMVALKVSKPRPSGVSKRVIWIDGGIHAREWIAISTAMYLAHKLTEPYRPRFRDEYPDSSIPPMSTAAAILDDYDWYILPVANPDGYEYSRNHDRLWRKTRKPNPGSSCVGTDPNRNWDIHWGENESRNPCSSAYIGSAPFSEQETRNMRDYMLHSIPQGVDVYITLHSYGQLWLVPWGYDAAAPPSDDAQLRSAAREAVNAIYQTTEQIYTVGTSPELLYPASGCSDDWAKAVLGAPYSYTIELRPSSQQEGGFRPNTTDIIYPTGEEIWRALHALALYI